MPTASAAEQAKLGTRAPHLSRAAQNDFPLGVAGRLHAGRRCPLLPPPVTHECSKGTRDGRSAYRFEEGGVESREAPHANAVHYVRLAVDEVPLFPCAKPSSAPHARATAQRNALLSPLPG